MAQQDLFGISDDHARDLELKRRHRQDKAAPKPSTQLDRVYRYLCRGRWASLEDISKHCGCSQTAASARIRDFRKAKFQHFGVSVEKRKLENGLWIYRLVAN